MVENPYTGETIATVAVGDEGDVDHAVAEATKHLPPASAAERAAILERAARLVSERAETFARTICLEAGKPLKQARAETQRCVDTLTFSAVEADGAGERLGALRHQAGGALEDGGPLGGGSGRQVLRGLGDGVVHVTLVADGDGRDRLAGVRVLDHELLLALLDGTFEQQPGGLGGIESRTVDRHRWNPCSSVRFYGHEDTRAGTLRVGRSERRRGCRRRC